MEHLYELLPYTFLTDCFIDYYEKHKDKGVYNQLSLKHRPGLLPFEDGCGMAYSLENNQKTFSEGEFVSLNPDLPEEIKNQLNLLDVICREKFQARLGRVRIINLKFKTCLSLHQDFDSFRLHIPLITNQKCFFIINEQFYKMPKEGSLYFLNTSEWHTAVNASFCHDRLHLVCSTYPLLF